VYRLADTWTWNGAGWKELNVSGPSPRAGAGMAPLGGKLVLFGGMDGSENVLSDTWTWDGSTWTALAAIGPPARQQALMATLGGAIVLFGGNDIGAPGGSTTYADTWTFDGSTWTEVASTGPALQAMASVSGPAVLAVDQAGGTWTFDGMTWTSLSVATLPGVFAPLLSAP
jgi:N-acetylneuraminic acid mutarotase